MTVLDTRWSWTLAGSDAGELVAAATIVVGVFDDATSAGVSVLAEQLGDGTVAVLRQGFAEHYPSTSTGVLRAGGQRIIAVRLGPRNALTTNALRTASFVAARSLGDTAGPVSSLLALELADAAGQVVEGHLLGAWSYERGPGKASQNTLAVVAASTDGAADAAVKRASVVAGVTNWVRQLVETPPNLLGPQEFSDAVIALAAELAPGLTTTVTTGDALAKRGFGALIGVGAGSTQPPRTLELSSGSGAPVGLAGKGITFDSGGNNLKRSAGELAWMKSDMAAAASVAGAVIAASALGTTRPLHAVLSIAENMPGGAAQRPGDVVTHPNGRTTEVTDTDSEGRLVLADAIAWLAKSGASEILDVGTLTDSGAVGVEYWGCWTTDDALATRVVEAGVRAGDPGWLLPLHESYADLIPSRVADSSNAPLDVPDTGQVAATYLRPFAADVPWVHIDNGSGAWLERDTRTWPAGPTGTPMRALVEYLAPSR